jgi:hypothetical protein
LPTFPILVDLGTYLICGLVLHSLVITLPTFICEDFYVLTSFYGPTNMKGFFLNWLHDMDMPNDINWIIVGDFNLIRSLEDAN